MVQLDFIKQVWMKISLKIFFVLLFSYALLRELGKKKINLELIFMAACFTMLVSYHRIYDVAFPLTAAVLLFNVYFLRGHYLRAGGLAVFIFFFLVPQSLIYKASALLGKIVGENHYILIGVGNYPPEIGHNFFPVLPLVCVFMALYSFWLYILSTKNEDANNGFEKALTL